MKNRSEAVKVFCSYPAVLRDSLVNLMKIQFFFIFSDFVLLHRYIKNPSIFLTVMAIVKSQYRMADPDNLKTNTVAAPLRNSPIART